MQLSWDGIVFDVVLLENWVREPIFDPTGFDFLYWHHVLDAIVTVGGDLNNRKRWPIMEVENNGDGRLVIDGGTFIDANGRTRPTFPVVSPNGIRLYKDKSNLTGGNSDLSSAMSGRRALGNPAAQNQFPWNDADIRTRLQLPRRQFLVWMYKDKGNGTPEPEFLIASPLTGVEIDARSGPMCTILSLPKIHGNVSGVFRLRFETWEVPFDASFSKGSTATGMVSLDQVSSASFAQTILSNQQPILSNRWKMRQEPDPETYLNKTVIEGTAIFRMDVLKVVKFTVDQLRKYFMHPMQFGYIRFPPQVEVSPGGDSVQYTIVDQEVMTNFPKASNLGLLHIEIQQQVQYNSPRNSFQG